MPDYISLLMSNLRRLFGETVNALLNSATMMPVLVGAALALLGGLITQALFLWFGLRHTRNVLTIALRSELKVLREHLGSSLNGLRLSLRQNETPRPNVFAVPTPVFDANAGSLGHIREADLVEHVVEVYNSLHELRALSDSFSGIPNEKLELRDLNEIHIFATISHVLVMKLHNRLLNVSPNGAINQNDTEAESRVLLVEIEKHLANGDVHALLSKVWSNA